MKLLHLVPGVAALGLVASVAAFARAQVAASPAPFIITKVDGAAGSFGTLKRCDITESTMTLTTYAQNNPLQRVIPVMHSDSEVPGASSHIGEFSAKVSGVPTPRFPSDVALTNYWVGHTGVSHGKLLKSIQGGTTALEDTSDEAQAIIQLLDAACP
jgi:hypothetical protein